MLTSMAEPLQRRIRPVLYPSDHGTHWESVLRERARILLVEATEDRKGKKTLEEVESGQCVRGLRK